MVTNCPVRKLIAPNRANDLRVGAWSTMGSLVSGGTHIRQRVPCYWKWHSSKLERSICSSFSIRRSFFICGLQFGISLRDDGPRLAQSESHLAENALALPHAQFHTVGLPEVMREQLSIPEVLVVAQFARRQPRRGFEIGPLRIRQPRASARMFAFVYCRKRSTAFRRGR